MEVKTNIRKNNWTSNLILGVLSSIIATIIITVSVKLYNWYNSIYGTWYAEKWTTGELAQEVTFYEDGCFFDGLDDATYTVDNGKLVIYYDSLDENSTYNYKIWNRKLYLYKHDNLYYIYIKKSLFD